MDEIDQEFHNSVKPNWGPTGTLVYRAPSNARPVSKSIEQHGLIVQTGVLITEGNDIRFAKFSDEV
jgi:nuclear pore complex protein Nup98-Nup96